MSDPVTWHRPEYRDRTDELVSLAQVAAIAGVTRAAVSNWRRRHDFPQPAMTAARTVWVVRAEAEQWLATGRRPTPGPRPDREAQRERVLARISRLEARERKQAGSLAATRKSLRRAHQQLTDATT